MEWRRRKKIYIRFDFRDPQIFLNFFEKTVDIHTQMLYYNQRRVSDQSIAG